MIGLKQGPAEQKIRDAGFTPSIVESNDTTEPQGTVIQQSPDAGQTPPTGSTITIVVSTYVEPTEEPDPHRDADHRAAHHRAAHHAAADAARRRAARARASAVGRSAVGGQRRQRGSRRPVSGPARRR